MIKFRLDESECYPVYVVDTYVKSINLEVEMSQEDYDEWQKCEELFQYWQDKLGDLYAETRRKKND
jgi:hypothetical protein